MSGHIRTTVPLDPSLLEAAKREAARRNKTLTAMIEEGLRLMMLAGRERPKRPSTDLPVSRKGGGTLPGVDLDDTAALTARMESDE